MRRPGYPSAEYAATTAGERLVYTFAAIYAAITVVVAAGVAVSVATGHVSREMLVAFALALVIGSVAVGAALLLRRQRLRRIGERAAFLASVAAEVAGR